MADCDRSAIDKLKEEKRAAAAAKRAAAPAVDKAATAAEQAPAAPAAPSGPLDQLAAAEAKAEKIAADIASITEQATAAADADALDALSKLAASIGGAVGGLQGERLQYSAAMSAAARLCLVQLTCALPNNAGLMDEIDLGELDDEARADARTRRKAINARVEGELEPAARTVRRED